MAKNYSSLTKLSHKYLSHLHPYRTIRSLLLIIPPLVINRVLEKPSSDHEWKFSLFLLHQIIGRL